MFAFNRLRHYNTYRLFDYPFPPLTHKHVLVILSASEPSLSLLPDNVALRIMWYLDLPSLISLAKVNRRYYHLHSDEYIWTDVDLSTVPKLNVQRIKRLIREKLHPALWRVTLQSNAHQCQRNSTLRPVITSAALDDLFTKCPKIRTIKLDCCDLSQVYNCLFLH